MPTLKSELMKMSTNRYIKSAYLDVAETTPQSPTLGDEFTEMVVLYKLLLLLLARIFLLVFHPQIKSGYCYVALRYFAAKVMEDYGVN